MCTMTNVKVRVVFIQKVLMSSSYPQTDKPSYFPELLKLAYKSDWKLRKNWGCLKAWQSLKNPQDSKFLSLEI